MKKEYHHQELREKLIEEGIKLISETGRSEFTIRRLAERCGVSHNAPYRHFADKEALLQAIIERVVQSFGKAMTESAGRYEGDPLEQIKQIGHSYIDFFVQNPEYFSILFTSDIMGHVSVHGNGFSFGQAHLFGILIQCFKAHWQSQGLQFDASIVLEYWSTVHGLTTLITSGKVVFEASYKAHVSKIIDRLADRLE